MVIETEGALRVLSESYIDAHNRNPHAPAQNAPDVEIAAKRLALENSSYLMTGSSSRFHLHGDADIAPSQWSAGIYAGNGVCAPGGSVDLRAAGAVRFTPLGELGSGASAADGCPLQAGGEVAVRAGGAVTFEDPDANGPWLGAGDPEGRPVIEEGAPPALDPAGSGVRQVVFAESLPRMGLDGPIAQFDVRASDPELARVLVSPTGEAADFTDLSTAVPLPTGWRWRVELTRRLVHAGCLDSFWVGAEEVGSD